MKKLKPPAPAPFSIAPWEHTGAQFEAMSHATVRAEIGGKKRNLLLKIRGGRIFFKEPSRSQIYATLDRFDEGLIGDALVEKWEMAVEADNYGALATKRDYLSRLPVRAQLIFLVRPDGSALVQEHFDGDRWVELPRASIEPDLWNSGSIGDAAGLLLGAAQNAVLDRAISPTVRDCDPSRFVGCTPAQFALLTRGALNAFVPGEVRSRLRPTITLKSHNAFHTGEVITNFKFIERSAPDFARVWEIILENHPFVGLNWHEGEEADNPYPRPRLERLWKAGIEKWGDNWRGNWAPQRAKFEFASDVVVSAHDQLESRLALRDFLDSLDNAESAELRGKL